MPISASCPQCSASAVVPESAIGAKVRCKSCQTVFVVAVPTSVSDVSAPPPPPAAEPSRSSEYPFLAPPQNPDEIGRLGRYRVLKLLGKGDSAIVFQAEDEKKRPVALKTLLPQVAGNAKAKEKFLRKAQAAAAIEHDHIIPIYNVGEEAGQPILSMPLLKGRTLADYLTGHSLSPKEAVRIAAEVAQGLAAAHKHKLTHRDIKPANIWLEGDRRKVRLLDFGLARTHSEGDPPAKCAYKAPEQARGEKIDGRADLFSLGCVLYEMLTDKRAFDGDSAATVLASLENDTPAPPAEVNGDVPDAVSEVAMKLLQKSPGDRYQSADEVVHALGDSAAEAGSGSVVSTSLSKSISKETQNAKSSGGGTKASAKAPPRPGAKPKAKTAPSKTSRSTVSPKSMSSSGGIVSSYSRPKKSSAGIWVTILLLLVILGGGSGVAAWFALQNESPADPVKTAKAAPPKTKTAKDAGEKKKDPVDVDTDKKTPTVEEKLPKELPKEKTPPKKPIDRPNEPVTLAQLEMSMPVELKQANSIKQLFTLNDFPNKVGMHTVEDKTHFFELYDIKKQLREAKVKLEDNVELMDVDPSGQTLVTTNADNFFMVYTLPQGGVIVDDWRPYSTPKDQMRFLTGGKIAQVAMVAKNRLFAMTTAGHGDGWAVIPGKEPSVEFVIARPERNQFRKDAIEADRDFVLSPDRKMFAYANDEGIEFRDARNGKVLGKTGKLSKFGGKTELAGMGFDPDGKRLAAYFTAAKAGGRPYFHTHFSVPGGEELFAESGPDPLDHNIEFVNGDLFFGFERKQATLRNNKGKIVATCNIAGKFGMFAPKLVHSNVAFAFLGEREVPSVGVVRVPLKTPELKKDPPPPKKTDPEPKAKDKDKDKDKGSSLGELFAPPVEPEPKTEPKVDPKADPKDPPTKAPPAVETQEIWEFSRQGIVRRGIRTLE